MTIPSVRPQNQTKPKRVDYEENTLHRSEAPIVQLRRQGALAGCSSNGVNGRVFRLFVTARDCSDLEEGPGRAARERAAGFGQPGGSDKLLPLAAASGGGGAATTARRLLFCVAIGGGAATSHPTDTLNKHLSTVVVIKINE